MTGNATVAVRGRRIRRWVLVALGLTLAALLLGLQFVFATTGGTLFLFSAVAPLFVAAAAAIVLGLIFDEYRKTHELFALERYPAGHVIFRQEDPGDRAYFIRSGTVEVVREEDGSIAATLGQGDYFGEMALLNDSPRNATVRAASSVELAVLGKRNFLSMLKLVPSTEATVLNTLRERAMHRFRIEPD